MSVVYRSSTTPVVANIGPGTPYVVTKPTGVVENDLMIMYQHVISAGVPQMAPPSDWRPIRGAGINGAKNVSLWAKEAGSSEPADYSVTVDTNATAGVGIVALYSDSVGRLKIEDVAIQTNASDTARTWPSVNFESSNGMLLCFGALGSSLASTPPGDMTERWDTTISGSRAYLMTRSISASGASGTKTATGSAATSKCISVAVAEGTPVNAGIRFRSVTASAAVSGTLISLGVPSDLVVNDIAVIALLIEDDRSFAAPAGWTALQSAVIGGSQWFYSWWKSAEAGDLSSTISFTFSGGSTSARMAIMAFMSEEGSALTINESSVKTATGVTTGASDSLTATQENACSAILAGRGTPTSLQYEIESQSDTWERLDAGSDGIGRLALWTENLIATGATATRTVTSLAGSENHCIVSFLVEYDTSDYRRIYPAEQYYTVTFAGADITAYCRLTDLEGVVQQLDATSLADDYPSSEPGSTDWRITMEGLLTKQIDDLLGRDALNPAYRDMIIATGEAGNKTSFTWTAGGETGAFVSNYRLGPNVQFGAIPFRAELGASGQPVRGTA